MDILIIALLIIAAIILFLIELFIIPGVSLAGIAAAACAIYANYYAFAYISNVAGIITFIISVVACVGSLIVFMRSKTLDRLSLKKNITSKVDRVADTKLKVGDQGVAVTRLALIGNADFDGNIVEVKSMDGFLDEGTAIVISRIAEGIIMIKSLKE